MANAVAAAAAATATSAATVPPSLPGSFAISTASGARAVPPTADGTPPSVSLASPTGTETEQVELWFKFNMSTGRLTFVYPFPSGSGNLAIQTINYYLTFDVCLCEK